MTDMLYTLRHAEFISAPCKRKATLQEKSHLAREKPSRKRKATLQEKSHLANERSRPAPG
jgi:hypothetical protein